ncbi:MAG: hypothetical protein LBT47_14155 [Deltaproteobacteria bacterium]|nr:hypothetical protein [Deltaproteobacteria bacterium]
MKTLFFSLLLLLVLTASSDPATGQGHGTDTPAQSSTRADGKIASGADDFAFRLAQELASETGDQNFVCSPFSVWLPLAALTGASQEPARSEMIKILAGDGLQADDLDRGALRLLSDLNSTLNQERHPDLFQNQLKIANAVFVSDELTLTPEFAKRFSDFYLGVAKNINFKSPEAVNEVNAWISANTGGKINQLVSEFAPYTVVALTNAIYLSDAWLEPFDPALTKKGPFHTSEGEVEADLMEQNLSVSYFEDAQLQALPLRLLGGGGLLLLLPKNGNVKDLLNSLSAEKIRTIDDQAVLGFGRLVLPRFKIESPALALEESLKQLGVPLFDAQKPSLTHGLVEGDNPLYLSQALHKALIEVDEHGLTAAASTVMGMVTSSLIANPKPFEMICNRPFAFVVYAKVTDNPVQVLFTGIVYQP